MGFKVLDDWRFVFVGVCDDVVGASVVIVRLVGVVVLVVGEVVVGVDVE